MSLALIPRMLLSPQLLVREVTATLRVPEPFRCFTLLQRDVPPSLLRLREELRESGLLTPLHERLLRILAAHASYPASVDHHDANDGGLVRHVTDVVRSILVDVRSAIAAASPGSRQSVKDSGRALVTLALAHDIAKPMCYERSGRGWRRVSARHAQWSAKILALLPELEVEYPESSDTLVLAVRCGHGQEQVASLGAEGERLLRHLRDADGRAAREARPEVAPVEHAVSLVVDHLPQIIRDLSVNRPGRGRVPDALYDPRHPARGEEVLLVYEAKFRTLLRQYIDLPSQRALSLWTRRIAEQIHPAWAAISDELIRREILATSVRGTSVDRRTRLVTALVHDRVARGLFPISLDWLSRVMGEQEWRGLAEHWTRERERGFEVRAIAPGVNATRADLEALDPASSPPETKDTGKCPACGEKLKKAGRKLRCEGLYRKTCRVELSLRNGEPVLSCDKCGGPLKPVFPRNRTPPFMGCASNCRQQSAGAPGGTESRREVTLTGGELNARVREEESS